MFVRQRDILVNLQLWTPVEMHDQGGAAGALPAPSGDVQGDAGGRAEVGD